MRFSDILVRMGWNFGLGFKTYGDEWRKERRMFHQEYKQNVVSRYHAIQMQKVNSMLQSILTDPSNFRDHIRE